MENIEYLKKNISIIINLYNAKRFEEIIIKGGSLIKKFPDQIIFYNATALAYNQLGRFSEAMVLLKKALKKESNNIFVLNNLGLVCVSSGNEIDAEVYYNKALNLKKDFLDSIINLGNLKMNQNKNEEAKELFTSALAINKNLETTKMALANYHGRTGNFEEAEKIYKEVLITNPSNTVADKSINLIHKYKDAEDEHLKSMENKVQKIKDKENLQRINFALGKAYEDIGEYKKSFQSYKIANDIVSNNKKYNINNDYKLFENLKKLFTSQILKPIKEPNQKIIFILGMPRSGTTLAEQILSSHPNVYGAGELSFLSKAIEKNILNNKKLTNARFETLDSDIFINIQKEYLSNLNMFNFKKEYLVDKAPLNFRWIGFIKIIFPNSKIIHCKRDSMDICWSNYKNSFTSKLLDYSYNFETLSTYYNLYSDLMNYWDTKFKGDIFELVYEDLVTDKEDAIKKLLNFCDLDWNDNCLNFHKNKKSVSTASMAQVRQPMYNTSVKRWKNYSNELINLVEKLKA
tara:strand:+ start:1984 stop:3537 length:1554 start_codon:yes stop_codon:yes gene_type:complete